MNYRHYTLGGLTVVVRADLPIVDSTYLPSIRKFETKIPGSDQVFLHHHFSLPSEPSFPARSRIYQEPPWEVFQEEGQFTYVHFARQMVSMSTILTATFHQGHDCGSVFHRATDTFLEGDNHSLTLFPTDQILFSRVLAERQGCIFHAGGMILNGQGLLFAGHSGAGKSTMMSLLRSHGEILCDDRNIVRRHTDGWQLYGTWSHGDIPDVSPNSAPLRAILLLEQAEENQLIPIDDRREIVRRLPFLIVKPLVTADWWEKTLDLVGQIAREVPIYRLCFTKSERVLDTLAPLLV